MSKFQERSLADITSAAPNAGINVSDLESAYIWIVGTFVGTVQAEISPDGTNYILTGAAKTAPAYIDIPAAAKYVRLNCTAYTSGTIEGVVTGVDEDRKG